jgi:hypothetical protein
MSDAGLSAGDSIRADFHKPLILLRDLSTN